MIEMASRHEWNPYDVSLGNARSKPGHTISDPNRPLAVRVTQMHASQSCDSYKYAHDNPISDHALLHNINPCLAEAKEPMIK